MAKKKYLICPGHVYSKHDGDFHFIGSKQLISLYGVNPSECVIDNDRRMPSNHGLIILGPRQRGDYEDYLKRANP